MAMDAAHGIYPPRWPSNNLQTLICRRLCQQPPPKEKRAKVSKLPAAKSATTAPCRLSTSVGPGRGERPQHGSVAVPGRAAQGGQARLGVQGAVVEALVAAQALHEVGHRVHVAVAGAGLGPAEPPGEDAAYRGQEGDGGAGEQCCRLGAGWRFVLVVCFLSCHSCDVEMVHKFITL